MNSERLKAAASLALAVAAGAVSGGVMSYLLSDAASEVVPQTLTVATVPTVSNNAGLTSTANVSIDGGSFGNSEQALAFLPPIPAQPTRSSPLDPEAERIAVQQRLDRLTQMHAGESRDRRWAVTIESEFESTYSQLQAQFELDVRSLDCRTSLCAAQLEVSSYVEARIHNQDILYAPRPDGCTIDVFAPPPEDETLPYLIQVFYGCRRDS